MKRIIPLTCALLALALVGTAFCGPLARRTATAFPGQGVGADPAFGVPVAVVVPPTLRKQVHLNTYVGGTQVSRIRSQFRPDGSVATTRELGPVRGDSALPGGTDGLGDYYIRGPRPHR